MKKQLLLIIFLFGENAYGQSGHCDMSLAAVPDTVDCLDSALLSVTFTSSVSCTTYGSPMNQNDYDNTQYTICACLACGDYAACNPGAKLMIAVIDSSSFQAWSNNNLNFGQLNLYPPGNCRNRPENLFQFSFADTAQVDSAASMLTNKIPNGDYILAYSFENYDYSLLDTSLAVALRNMGFNGFDTLKNVPFIYFIQKGKPFTAFHYVGSSSTDVISLTATLTYIYPLPNLTYSWTPCNTLDSCSLRSPKAKPNATTVYYLTATDTVTHFTLFDSVTVVSNCPNAVKDYISDNIIYIYPNPAGSQLNIHTSSFHNDAVTVSIVNVLGEIMQEEKLKWSDDASINIAALSSGIYFLLMKTESGSIAKKFVKE